jgi:hypothetical protein
MSTSNVRLNKVLERTHPRERTQTEENLPFHESEEAVTRRLRRLKLVVQLCVEDICWTGEDTQGWEAPFASCHFG